MRWTKMTLGVVVPMKICRLPMTIESCPETALGVEAQPFKLVILKK